MEPLVTIIIPMIRPEKAQRCIDAIEYNACVPSSVYKVEVMKDVDGIGCPKMVDKMVREKVKTPLVMFLGDDTVPERNFLYEALMACPDAFPYEYPKADKPYLVGLNDGTGNGYTFATHWLASMKLLDLLPDRQFFNTAYNHCFCDYELTDIAKEKGCYIYSPKAKIIHDHPQLTGIEQDEFYEKIYADDNYMDDRETFWRRKRERVTDGTLLNRVGIGEPNIAGKVDREYHISFLMMDKPSQFHFFYPDRDMTEFAVDWAHVRNNLSIQAMNEGCTCLAMLDTDQEYAPDTLMKLFNNPAWKRPETAMVGGLVYKRHKPYTPVVRRGPDPDHYVLPSKEELDSGKTIEIDGIGSGCVVVKTEFLLDAQSMYPWFKEVISQRGKRVSEDFNFCYKLRRLGYRIYCDTSVNITHWTRMGINRYTYEVIQKFKEESNNGREKS